MSGNIFVIGGGASGLIAAIMAARNGSSVTILEKNERCGKKILMTGNGHCNLTNEKILPESYFSRDRDKIASIFSHFTPEQTLDFFKEIGIPTRKKGSLYYPRSNQASTVLQHLLREAEILKVKIKTRENVRSIADNHGKGYLIQTDSWSYQADGVIVCCGSWASLPRDERTDVSAILSTLRHHQYPFMPALTGLIGKSRHYGWAGIRMDATVSLYLNGNQCLKETGEVQFTEYGLSGIPIFQISGPVKEALNKREQVTLFMDLLPDYSQEALSAYLITQTERYPGGSGLNYALSGLFPEKMLPILTEDLSSDDNESTTISVACRCKNFSFQVKNTCSFEKAQVCSGGIPLKELSDQMESIHHPNLFFAGEVTDVNGICGGFNLQWAWTTGAIAGKTLSKRLS